MPFNVKKKKNSSKSEALLERRRKKYIYYMDICTTLCNDQCIVLAKHVRCGEKKNMLEGHQNQSECLEKLPGNKNNNNINTNTYWKKALILFPRLLE